MPFAYAVTHHLMLSPFMLPGSYMHQADSINWAIKMVRMDSTTIKPACKFWESPKIAAVTDIRPYWFAYTPTKVMLHGFRKK
jgi:hypothetical protein